MQAGALPPLKHSKPWGSSGGGGGGGGGGWGASTNSWDAKVGSKTKNIIQKARKEAKEIGVFQRLGDPKRAGRGTSAINDGMRQRIRSAEEVRAERDKIAAQSRSNGRASGATMKRKAAVVVDEHEEEENEEERRSKAEEFRRKAMQPRAAMTVGPRAKVAPEKKAVDPFFRPKKTTAAPTNSQGRR